MPAGAGRAERGACRAAARHTGETQDDSGWNRLKASQALGPPRARERERGRHAQREGAPGSVSFLPFSGRRACPPAPIQVGREEREQGPGHVVCERPKQRPQDRWDLGCLRAQGKGIPDTVDGLAGPGASGC